MIDSQNAISVYLIFNFVFPDDLKYYEVNNARKIILYLIRNSLI